MYALLTMSPFQKPLPTEIYRMIISEVNNLRNLFVRNKTLIALLCSCKLFNRIAEEFLYANFRRSLDLEKAEQFEQSLRLDSRRALYVKSLKFDPVDACTLFNLLHQCLNLQELELDRTLGRLFDIKQTGWVRALALKRPKMGGIGEISDCIVQCVPRMTALKTIVIRDKCKSTPEMIQALAKCKAPLQHVELECICDAQDKTADDATNIAVANMITAHSSTLQNLVLQYVGMGPPLLASCKQARKLRLLWFDLAYTPSAVEVDDLLETCLELQDYTGKFSQVSLRKDEWEARLKPLLLASDTLMQGGPK